MQKATLSSAWFVRLRWCAFIGQCAVLAAAREIFNLTLPYQTLIFLLALIPLSNFTATLALRRVTDVRAVIGALLIFDTLLLSAILFCAGGPTNPFSIVYLLHVVLAAVMLGTTWTWAIALLSSVCFGMLFLFSLPVPEWEHHDMTHGFSLHLQGMLLSYSVVALLIAYFLTKIIDELRAQERKVQRLEVVAANQQRLASLTTLAAGAAHELGTPLATIAVVAHELERAISRGQSGAALLEDVALLKTEAERCKSIISGLAAHSGDVVGEMPQTVSAEELLQDVIAQFEGNSQIICDSDPTLTEPLFVPRQALTQILQSLVKNALDASGVAKPPVLVSAAPAGKNVSFIVLDSGAGMTTEEVARLGEPFFTTKPAGKGMGLGVYLAKLVSELLGGTLSFESSPGCGTRVQLEIPRRAVSVERKIQGKIA